MKMKAISLIVVKVLAVISANVAFLWALIEFIIYLVKDTPFNWWSVWAFIISVVVAITVAIYGAVYSSKIARSEMAKMRTGMKKSKWAQRIEEMQQKQGKIKSGATVKLREECLHPTCVDKQFKDGLCKRHYLKIKDRHSNERN